MCVQKRINTSLDCTVILIQRIRIDDGDLSAALVLVSLKNSSACSEKSCDTLKFKGFGGMQVHVIIL